MTVADLMDRLRDADPDATVMLLPNGDDEQDAQEVRAITVGGVGWTYERGIDKGRAYEFLYAGEPHIELRTDCEDVTYKKVDVVMLAADEESLHSARLR
jgi:hypothetical protein